MVQQELLLASAVIIKHSSLHHFQDMYKKDCYLFQSTYLAKQILKAALEVASVSDSLFTTISMHTVLPYPIPR